jgi:hypothetical protein
MVLDLLDPATLGRLVGIIFLMVLAAAVGYASGFKQGKREGYIRGRAMSRHIAATKRKAVK